MPDDEMPFYVEPYRPFPDGTLVSGFFIKRRGQSRPISHKFSRSDATRKARQLNANYMKEQR